MKTMPSSEFRKTYAKLSEPVVVTVNEHPIGRWNPYHPGDLIDGYIPSGQVLDFGTRPAFRPAPKLGLGVTFDAKGGTSGEAFDDTNRQVFRPAPKPGKGK